VIEEGGFIKKDMPPVMVNADEAAITKKIVAMIYGPTLE
jgi:hypothetical protein